MRPTQKSSITRVTSFSRSNPRVDVIFNSVSGTRDPDRDLTLIRSSLQTSFEDVRIWSTSPEKGGEELGKEAIDSGANVLVACGGDGTVAGVASAMKNAAMEEKDLQLVLGVIPRGTANAICAALDIPSKVKRAASMIASGNVRTVDFPCVAHEERSTAKSMLLLCGIGFEAETVKRANREMKRSLGAVAYAIAGLESTVKQEIFTTDLVLHGVEDSLMFAEGRMICGKLHMTGLKLKGVTIANAAPATSVLAQGIGEVRPDDGLMEVVCITSHSPLGMVRLMFSMLKSALLRTRERRGTVYGLRAKKVEIVCDPPQRIVLDGEDAGFTPIVVELDSQVDRLRVIAPKAETVNRRRRRLSRSLVRLWRNLRGVAVLAVTVSLVRRARRH